VVFDLGLNNQPAPGQIFHVEGASTGGVRVMDVWESEEAFGKFSRSG
jgi:hypothetical protein